MKFLCAALGFVVFLTVVGPVTAQRRDEILPPRVDRKTVVDEEGLKQWAEYEAPDCPVCKGEGTVECQRCKGIDGVLACLECELSKEAPCHACGGTGKLADPLEKAICPGCNGAGSYPCFVCMGKGGYELQGGGGRTEKCSACRGDGGFECQVCDGDRLVGVVRLRPSLAEADLEDLREARQKIEDTLVAVRDFTGLGTSRKDIKEYSKVLAMADRLLPPLKKAQEMVEDLMLKQLVRGDRIAGNDERKAAAFQRFRACNESYLEHQIKAIDLCIARQEFNAKVREEKEAAQDK